MNTAKPVVVTKYNQHLEDTVLKKDAEFKDMARRDGKHFARHEQPELQGDHLTHYTGKFSTGYEGLVAYALQYLQPARHKAEAKMETDLAREKDVQLDGGIKMLERQIANDQYDLGDFHPGNIFRRAYIVLLVTGIMFIGETLFNTQALQITGGSLLFSFIIALSVSLAVFVLSHIAPLLYKKANSRLTKTFIAVDSFIAVSILFTVLAIFRSQMLERHGTSTNPISFVIFNLFIFSICTLVSYCYFPSAQEIREKQAKLRLFKTIQKNEREIERMKKERETLRKNLKAKIEQHLLVSHYADHLCKCIRKMYRETVELFKSTNLIYRKGVPDCFNEMVPDIEIDHAITYISLKENKQ